MTEAEWQRSLNPHAMLAEVRDKGSDRIWRLLAVACVRRVEALMRYTGSRQALEVAERFADGSATLAQLGAARALAEQAALQAHADELEDELRVNFGSDAAYEAVCAAAAADAALACVAEAIDGDFVPEYLRLPDLIREVFGSPFRCVEADPAWLLRNDGAARGLAQSIYAERAFDRLPILADALEDAGCADAALLGHLRSAGPHVRGCWALDLVLGKG